MIREYKVFKDSIGKIFVVWSDMIRNCLFAGSIGELTEMETGSFERDRDQLKNIMSVVKTYK